MAVPSPVPRPDRWRSCSVVPWLWVQPVLSAILEGSTDGQAMLAAGLTQSDRLSWERLAAEGHPVWEQVIRELRVARYDSTRRPTSRRRQIAESESSTMADTERYLERVLPDDYGPVEAASGPAAGGRVVINLVTSFDQPVLPARVIDVGMPTPSLPSSAVTEEDDA